MDSESKEKKSSLRKRARLFLFPEKDKRTARERRQLETASLDPKEEEKRG